MSEGAGASYAEVVAALLARQNFERTGSPAEAKGWDLAHVRAYLEARGHPERRRTIHVAGTRGKGSTAAMAASILGAAGARALLETSPHLHEVRERVAVDGAPLDEAHFARAGAALLADPRCAGWSFFELCTVLGWIAAEELRCDWQVLEVGLGGRLDTTNAIDEKLAAVITPLDLEHTAILGDTIEQIAAEKAGIITTACDVVVSPPIGEAALDVVRRRAAEAGARVHLVDGECDLAVTEESLSSQRLDLRTPVRAYVPIRLPLLGPHQATNAAVAVRAVELAWQAANGAPIDEAAVRRGLERVRNPGRFEIILGEPLVVLDAMHTRLSAERFRETVERLPLPARRALVFAALADKRLDAIAVELVPLEVEVYVAPAPSPRTADPTEVATIFRARGLAVRVLGSVREALDEAARDVGRNGAVFVTGGVYTVAEARAALRAAGRAGLQLDRCT